MFVAPPGTRIVRQVGAGSTFQVALVEREAGEPGVALVAKRVRPGLTGDPLAIDALSREVAALSVLPPGLAPALLDRGSDAHGGFVLEELVPGPSLRAAHALAPAERASLARRTARLVTQAHATADAQGSLAYVHGDPTPDHFVLDARGALRLLDHGASRSRVHPAPSPGRGTLPFVAPELARGETPPTAATDRYAVAVVIAELLLGARLVRGREHAAMLLEIGDVGHDLSALTRLPDALRRALAAQLDADVRARPAALDELADASLYDALDIAIGS